MSRSLHRWSWTVSIVAFFIVNMADAGGQRGARGGARGAARTSVNRSGSINRSADINRNANVNRNVDVNRNVNVNRDFDRDIDVDVDNRYGGAGYGCCYHPVARATAAVATAAAIGSVVNSLPASCTAVSIDGYTYQQCGSTWYQPRFAGSTVTYIVVNPPG